jgi:cytidyltransferase-like protein
MVKKVVVVTGGFDPIHSGHIEYFEAAKKLGDTLIVGINSDEWLQRKKSRAFMSLQERIRIVSSLAVVDTVYSFDDSDDTAISFIEKIKEQYFDDKIIFANGGDRTASNIPEMSVQGVEFVFGVGGEDKKNSSSWILEEWKAPKTERQWGYYRVLHEVDGMKVKELTVNPGESLSMQRHQHRSEHWVVSEGSVVVNIKLPGGYNCPPATLEKHDQHNVPKNEWHQLTNPFNHPCKLVEIQFGDACIEEDIERK